MRRLITAALAIALLGGAAEAKDMKSCSADWKTAKAGNATGGQSHLAFMASCMKGGTAVSQTVTTKAPVTPAKTVVAAASPAPAPAATVAAGAAPSGATAQCKDGSFSMSAHHSGSCSHHGGVAKFLQ